MISKSFFDNQHAPNKSLDVRAKQRLCFHVVRQTLACVLAVSPHVNSAVRRFAFREVV